MAEISAAVPKDRLRRAVECLVNPAENGVVRHECIDRGADEIRIPVPNTDRSAKRIR